MDLKFLDNIKPQVAISTSDYCFVDRFSEIEDRIESLEDEMFKMKVKHKPHIYIKEISCVRK